LDFLRERLPERRQIFIVFLAIIFPVNFWSLIVFFRELPSYLMRMKIWDIAGIFSYTQLIVLLDCLIILTFILGLAFVFPRKYFLDQFTPQATIASYIAILWIIPFHFRTSLITLLPAIQRPWFIWFWMGIFFIIFLSSIYWIMHSTSLQNAIRVFVDKLSVVSSVYLALSLIGLVVITIRNFGLR
jgi:hypothetical protein